MNTIVIKLSLISCFFLLLTVSFAFSQGKGREHKNNSPSGWEKGEKKGWNSDVPPGKENRLKKTGNLKKQKSNLEKPQGAEKDKTNHKNKKLSPTTETHKKK